MSDGMLGDSLRRRRGRSAPASAKQPQRRRAPRDRRGGGGLGRWLVTALVLLAVAFGAGYAFAALVWFPPAAEAGDTIEVPDLAGEPLGGVRRVLEERGLRLGTVTEIAADRAGDVVAQSPLPGQRLMPAGTVHVAVAVAPRQARVPAVLGMGVDAAELVLEKAGLAVERHEVAVPVPAGRVVGVEPEPGTPVALPGRVTLIVSSGGAVADTLEPWSGGDAAAPPPEDTLPPRTVPPAEDAVPPDAGAASRDDDVLPPTERPR